MAFNAIVASTLFLRTRIHPNSIDNANLYLAVLFFTLTSMLFNNWVRSPSMPLRLVLDFRVHSSSARLMPANPPGSHGCTVTDVTVADQHLAHVMQAEFAIIGERLSLFYKQVCRQLHVFGLPCPVPFITSHY